MREVAARGSMPNPGIHAGHQRHDELCLGGAGEMTPVDRALAVADQLGLLRLAALAQGGVQAERRRVGVAFRLDDDRARTSRLAPLALSTVVPATR